MSRCQSAQFCVENNQSRSNSRERARNTTNQMELIKQQIRLAFQHISSSINQSQDENLIALEALSEDARAQYTNRQLLRTRLANGELIVDKELQDARKGLATLERATHDEQERLKIAIAQEFRHEEAQQKENAKSSEVRDKILKAEVLSLKVKFAEQLKKQDTEWQRVLRHQEDGVAELLNLQKANAADQYQKDPAAKELRDKQNQKFHNVIQALTDRIDHHEKPSFTIPLTEAGDGDPGPSNQGQFDPRIPPNNPNPDKRSASTPRQDHGKRVDQGGNYQPPPPPPSNTSGDPDLDPSNHDDHDGKGGDDGRDRRGERPNRNPRRPSVPRDTSPRTKGMLESLQQLSTPTQSMKNAAEAPYFVQGDHNQDVRNWLTACEDYFDRNPYQWENHSHRIVFALGNTKGNKVAPFAEKDQKVMGGIGGFTRDANYATWERFQQQIIRRYIGIEEERRALEEMDRIT